METGIVVAVIAVIGAFMVLGYLIYRAIDKPKVSQGILNIDYSDPEDGPYLFLELKAPIADVISKKQVIFDVKRTNIISQK